MLEHAMEKGSLLKLVDWYVRAHDTRLFTFRYVWTFHNKYFIRTKEKLQYYAPNR